MVWLFSILLFLLGKVSFLQSQSDESAQRHEINRVIQVMYHGDRGIDATHKESKYAQTLHLQKDLVIPQLALAFPTQTILGKYFLLDALSNVVSPVDTTRIVERRKHALEYMVNHKDFQKEVADLMQEVKPLLDDVLHLFSIRNAFMQSLEKPEESEVGKIAKYILDPLADIKNAIARNPWYQMGALSFSAAQFAMLAYSAKARMQNAYQTFIDPTFRWTDTEVMKQNYKFYNQIPHKDNIWVTNDPSNFWTMNPQKLFFDYTQSSQDLLSKEEKEQIQHKAYQKIINNMSDMWSFPNMQNLLKLLLPGTFESISKPGFEFLANGSSALFLSTYLYIQSDAFYKLYKNSFKKRNILHSLSKLVNIAQKFETLCQQYGIEVQYKPSNMQHPDGLALLKELNSYWYTNKDSMLVAQPFIETFITKLYEHDKYLASYFAIIAEMDAYQALAQKMIDHQTAGLPLCFTRVLSDAKPAFAGKNMWNILLKHPVGNSTQESRNIILTGPNAGGKSTFMRSVLQNIVLSQTFGIAAAADFALTPYDYIYSFLNVKDDIEQGLSRYQAELHLAVDIVQKAAQLSEHEKFFFILDELFTSTGSTDGELCAYEFVCDDLAPYDGKIQYIFATHFDLLKKLESAKPQQFANYQVNAPTRQGKNTYVYPFTISPGVSNQSIAYQLKRDAGLLGSKKGA